MGGRDLGGQSIVSPLLRDHGICNLPVSSLIVLSQGESGAVQTAIMTKLKESLKVWAYY